MPKYVHLELGKDRLSSTSSISVHNLIEDTAQDLESPPGREMDNQNQTSAHSPYVRYSINGVMSHFCVKATFLERLLMFLVIVLIIIISVLSVFLGVHFNSQKFTNVPTINDTQAITSKGCSNPFHTNLTTIDDTQAFTTKDKAFCLTPTCINLASRIINDMDTTRDPCADFYTYACGGWIKSNLLPNGNSVWDAFGKLIEENQLVLKKILDDSTLTQKSEAERKAIIYYNSCLDKNGTIEKLGSKPLLDILKKIGGWHATGKADPTWNIHSALKILNTVQNRGTLFTWIIGQDPRNSSRNVLQVDQGSLGLPTRHYYLNKTDHDQIMNAYLDYMTKVAVLLGGEENSARSQMKEVVEFEKELAKIMIPEDQRLDDEKTYHRMTLAELQNIAPVYDWTSYFNTYLKEIDRTIESTQEVVVYAPVYLKHMSDLVKRYLSKPDSLIILRNFVGWATAEPIAPLLSKPFQEAYKHFRKALYGSEGKESRWRNCVASTNSMMGFPLGAMFIKAVFPNQTKIEAEKMINEVRDAFKKNLSLLKWLDEETRNLAIEKADAITDMIGYPDLIMNATELDNMYKELEFTEDEYLQNIFRGSNFSNKKMLESLFKSTEKSEWIISPATVNAFYAPKRNQIVVPAGILQAPFFDPNFPKSLQFGAMGVVMGHELTHAFDVTGREYDKQGNLRQWWSDSSVEKFQEQAECFADQYSSYEINGEHLKGNRTLGENMADNGGLKAAFRAYESWLERNENELLLPGVNLTHRQLFFIGFSQVWCSTSTPEITQLLISTDPHSIARFRVTGTLSNSEDFVREFNCSKKSVMNSGKKCEVW